VTINDQLYTITAFKYNDNNSIIEAPYNAGLMYTVLKDTPLAITGNQNATANQYQFNANVTDADNAIIGDNVEVVVYARNDQTTIIDSFTIPKIGANDITITNLDPVTDYDLYIKANYNILDGNTYSNNNIMPV